MKSLTILTNGIFGHCSDLLNLDYKEIIKVFLDASFSNYDKLEEMKDLSEEIEFLDIEFKMNLIYQLDIEYKANTSEKLIHLFHLHLLSAIKLASTSTQGNAEYNNGDFSFKVYLFHNKLEMEVLEVL